MQHTRRNNSRCETATVLCVSASLIVQLLAQRPTPELQRARDQMRADISRLTVELEQVEEALTRQSRRTPRSARLPAQPGGTKKHILDVVDAHSEPLLAAAIHEALEQEGFTGSRGTVHTTLGRLVNAGTLEKIGEAGSLRYQRPSRNGASAAASSGPAKNGATESLLPATGPQGGT